MEAVAGSAVQLHQISFVVFPCIDIFDAVLFIMFVAIAIVVVVAVVAVKFQWR